MTINNLSNINQKGKKKNSLLNDISHLKFGSKAKFLANLNNFVNSIKESGQSFPLSIHNFEITSTEDSSKKNFNDNVSNQSLKYNNLSESNNLIINNEGQVPKSLTKIDENLICDNNTPNFSNMINEMIGDMGLLISNSDNFTSENEADKLAVGNENKVVADQTNIPVVQNINSNELIQQEEPPDKYIDGNIIPEEKEKTTLIQSKYSNITNSSAKHTLSLKGIKNKLDSEILSNIQDSKIEKPDFNQINITSAGNQAIKEANLTQNDQGILSNNENNPTNSLKAEKKNIAKEEYPLTNYNTILKDLKTILLDSQKNTDDSSTELTIENNNVLLNEKTTNLLNSEINRNQSNNDNNNSKPIHKELINISFNENTNDIIDWNGLFGTLKSGIEKHAYVEIDPFETFVPKNLNTAENISIKDDKGIQTTKLPDIEISAVDTSNPFLKKIHRTINSLEENIENQKDIKVINLINSPEIEPQIERFRPVLNEIEVDNGKDTKNISKSVDFVKISQTDYKINPENEINNLINPKLDQEEQNNITDSSDKSLSINNQNKILPNTQSSENELNINYPGLSKRELKITNSINNLVENPISNSEDIIPNINKPNVIPSVQSSDEEIPLTDLILRDINPNNNGNDKNQTNKLLTSINYNIQIPKIDESTPSIIQNKNEISINNNFDNQIIPFKETHGKKLRDKVQTLILKSEANQKIGDINIESMINNKQINVVNNKQEIKENILITPNSEIIRDISGSIFPSFIDTVNDTGLNILEKSYTNFNSFTKDKKSYVIANSDNTFNKYPASNLNNLNSKNLVIASDKYNSFGLSKNGVHKFLNGNSIDSKDKNKFQNINARLIIHNNGYNNIANNAADSKNEISNIGLGVKVPENANINQLNTENNTSKVIKENNLIKLNDEQSRSMSGKNELQNEDSPIFQYRKDSQKYSSNTNDNSKQQTKLPTHQLTKTLTNSNKFENINQLNNNNTFNEGKTQENHIFADNNDKGSKQELNFEPEFKQFNIPLINNKLAGNNFVKSLPNQAFANQQIIFPEELPGSILNLISQTPVGETVKATLILKPESLGTVFVEITIKAKNTDLKITAESKDTLRTIESQMPVLRERLSNQGLHADNINYRLRDSENDMLNNNNFQNNMAKKEDEQTRKEFVESFKYLNNGYNSKDKLPVLNFMEEAIYERIS